VLHAIDRTLTGTVASLGVTGATARALAVAGAAYRGDVDDRWEGPGHVAGDAAADLAARIAAT
jgi:hypothetical protein